ncbi:response regulator [Pelagicoccus sp. SDUM812002]|uniref:response regulator n=1 Tax=Pelagicoccus sp. SDUM812002 TaxID=3041266 RepID=UPI00280CD3CC|nr:response regulator [Pelagicoccus sp. SDUM812002]MDQ8184141.1 response regulator [Pelagicoccus sp. SDUM812002]
MNKKILIVRGDKQNAKALSFLLAGSGYQISAHSSAGEAIEAARHQRFDLAITDEALPENQPDLSLVSNLKEAQPALPIFYLANQQSVETVISCIRAGVTEVLNDPSDLKGLLEMTRSFLRGADKSPSEDEVTWEDILQVERLLDSAYPGSGNSTTASPTASSAEVKELKDKLDSALADRDRTTGELATTLAKLEKARRLVDELKNDSGNKATDSEIQERAAELDERERKLKETSTKLTQQKFEVESQLAELEAQQIEFEEAQKEALPMGGNADISNQELDSERAKFNEVRLDLQATIQDLQRELEVVKTKASSNEDLQNELVSLREKIQDANEAIAEKDFIIEQRDRELESLKENLESTASNLQVEELEDAKRLVEIERHKLRERIDQLELEKRLSDEKHQKDRREIQVERRDAEISLREMQNAIKEEQLKLKVEQATLKDELRQFEQARTNFQEDVQELQNKQAELKKMEAYLNQMEESIKANGVMAENTLPKPDSSAFEPIQTTPSAPQAVEQSGEASGNEETKKPESWGKPDMEKKAGRGPLRIGRRSSF